MKRNKRIYLSPPHIGEKEMEYVNEAFRSNWIAPLGPNVSAFEDELAQYVGCKGALAVSSGTAAIHLALLLLGVKKGDTVFCSSLTFVASANPITYVGATPVFIDSDYETWNMSPSALKKAFIHAKKEKALPKAVIVVNLYGQSADYDKIKGICDSYGVPIIEDAAESLGATYKGKSSGTIGKLGVFSFNGNKIITTSGGGMLVSNDSKLLEKARFLATQARENVRHYEHKEAGFNYRLSNVLAGIGRGQLQKLNERINVRRTIYHNYKAALEDLDGVSFMEEASFGRSNRWLTTLTVKSNEVRENVINYLEMHNIEARPVWKPLHLQPLFKGTSYFSHSDNISVSDDLFERGLCLPSGSNLTEEEQRVIITLLKRSITGKDK